MYVKICDTKIYYSSFLFVHLNCKVKKQTNTETKCTIKSWHHLELSHIISRSTVTQKTLCYAHVSAFYKSKSVKFVGLTKVIYNFTHHTG